jgi:hypothetical protein
MSKRLLFTLALAVGTANSLAAADPVTFWNTVVEKALAPTQGANPVGQSRIYAILHASIHDALNAIDARYASYTPGLARDPGASAAAAVAATSRSVLTTLIPDQVGLIGAAYANELAAIADGPAKIRGIALGEAAAQSILRRRLEDGADRSSDPVFVPRTGPGEYQFTEPFTLAAFPGWDSVTPFAIVLREHELDGPLALSNARYASDFQFVKEIGRVDSWTRTAEQSEIAQFWYEDCPLAWNRITNTVVRRRDLDPWQAVRAFALVNFAMADAYIAGFAAKYEFRFSRPVTAIRNAASDSNESMEPDTAWQPFQVTPPVPDYPSTHALVGAAAAEILIDLFGDRIRYETTSLTLPGVSRSFHGFSNAAQENGDSRIFAGIHSPHAVRDGQRQGRSIGKAVGKLLPPAGKAQDND